MGSKPVKHRSARVEVIVDQNAVTCTMEDQSEYTVETRRGNVTTSLFLKEQEFRALVMCMCKVIAAEARNLNVISAISPVGRLEESYLIDVLKSALRALENPC